jgi:mannose-6-phosphate isomerase-like protein (cupin superfamily)
MVIDFSKILEIITPHQRGGEKEFASRKYEDSHCKILLGKLIPGASIGTHTHETDSEVLYILSGTGKVLYSGSYESVFPGLCHYCPCGHTHSLINDSNEDLVFFAVVPRDLSD